MSVFEKELRTRIERDGPASAGNWFIDVIASGALSESEMSPLERGFWDLIVDNYERWLAAKRSIAN
jgi:hypothetical protein